MKRPLTPNRQRGFSLVEVLVALVVFLVAAGFAAQLLSETAQQLTDVAAEQTEAPLPLVRARLRADIQASHEAVCIPRLDGTPEEVRLLRHPEGTVIYRVEAEELHRAVDGASADSLVLRGVESWTCNTATGLLWLQFNVRRRAVRRTPLIVEPGARGPLTETHAEELLVAPRGGGLGEGW